MQVKKIIAVLLTVCLLFSLSVPAYAVDEVYNIADDVVPTPIYYTDGYYPGIVAEMRNAGMFANRIAHGSYSAYNYNPTYIYRSGSSYINGDFNSLTPFVTADQTDVSGLYMVDRTTLLSGQMLIFYLPSTSDSYFDFQSSNFVFDQQDANANTFYINGTLTFNLRNLWNFSGTYETTSFYLASDPLAVQLVIDGKAYGDIIDVTGYTSPFTALYNGGIPTNASVTFDNMKVYYQGDTPDMIGFRVYTGSSFTDGQYNYNSAGDFVAVDVENTITLRCSEVPDITFVQEGGDGYAGDLSGISGLLNRILSGISDLCSFLEDPSGLSWLMDLYNTTFLRAGSAILNPDGSVYSIPSTMVYPKIISNGFLGLASLSRKAHSYVSDTVFAWQSYNMQTHQLNTATNVTGQNNLFFTAFQSIEDKLGRLAYVFGSDEDIALKDSSDPGTDAFRENFGGGLSLGQIKDGADVVEGVSGLFDSGYDFGDAFTEISGDSMFIMWFSSQNAAALDSTSSVMALDDDDPYNMQIYYDRIHEVTAKRDREEDDTNG